MLPGIGTVMETLGKICGDRSAPTFAVEAARVGRYLEQISGKGPTRALRYIRLEIGL